jgi:hypothetical protein
MIDCLLCVAALGLHVASAHLDVAQGTPPLSGINPGVYVEFKRGAVLGVYHNSLGRRSAYAAYKFNLARNEDAEFGVALGGVTGYDWRVSPFVLPTLRLALGPRYGARIDYVPKTSFTRAHVFHLSLEYKF